MAERRELVLMQQIAAYAYLILMLLYAVASILMGIALAGFLIYRGVKNRQSGKCFFHDLRISDQLQYIAGAHWYYECPGCGAREAVKMRKGESPLNQRWLDGGEWDHPLNPCSLPPETVNWQRFLARPIVFKKYPDWQYTPLSETKKSP